jgi:thiaminase (transcriptional activator TenA)
VAARRLAIGRVGCEPAGMSRSRELFRASVDLVEACAAHPFVRGIASGDLPRERFVFYVEQDAWFLTAFARAYAIALAKAPDVATMERLRPQLDGVFEELQLHRGYAERWDANLDPEPAGATLGYTDFLLRVAWSEPVGHTIAAMVPCMRLYAHLGQALTPHATPTSPYLAWVETYADPSFEELASNVEELLDGLDGDEHLMASHYRTAMRRELEFFDQAFG